MSVDTSELLNETPIIIVDDLLGGGKTVQMLIDILKDKGYDNPLHLWVEYNEGFHTAEFLSQFASTSLGELV